MARWVGDNWMKQRKGSSSFWALASRTAVAAFEDPEIFIEEINLAGLGNPTEILIEDIDGVSIKDNFPVIVFYCADIATTGTSSGNVFSLRVRQDNGSGTGTIRTTDYGSHRWTVAPQAPQTNGFILDTGTGYASPWGILTNVTVAAPTVMEGHTGETSSVGQHMGVYPHGGSGTVEKHDAIIFRVNTTSGSRQFTGGTITIMGFRYPSGSVSVVTADMDNAASVNALAPSGQFTWCSLVALDYQRDAATGRPQMRLGVDGAYETSSGDYFSDWYRQTGSTSNPSQTATFIQAGTDDHATTSTTIARIMNLNVGAPCTVVGHCIDDTTGDSAGTMRFMGLTRNQQNINDIQFGNLSGGSDFAPGSGLLYAVFYRVRVDVTAHALSGLSEQEMTNISEMVHLTTEIASGVGNDTLTQHGDGGGFITSADHHRLEIRSNTITLDSNAQTAAGRLQAGWSSSSEPGILTVFGLNQSFVPLYSGMDSSLAGGNNMRSNRAHRPVANATYTRLKALRSTGTWGAGTLYESRYRTKV